MTINADFIILSISDRIYFVKSISISNIIVNITTLAKNIGIIIKSIIKRC